MADIPRGLIEALEDVATRLRIDSVRATTAAGSGHPTSCASAADLVAAIFFAAMRLDPERPREPESDGSCSARATRRRCSTPPGPRAAPSGART